MSPDDRTELHNDSLPLAYLITIRFYDTSLEGDTRESVEEPGAIKSATVSLSNDERALIDQAIKDVCNDRKYLLRALTVRSNFAHAVVSSDRKPEIIMGSFEACATRKLSESGLANPSQKIWSRNGSAICLWKESHIESAMDYVFYDQSDERPNFI